MSMLTSRYPTQHRGVSVYDALDAAELTLPEVLDAHGYRTAAFITNPVVSAQKGFDQGFKTFTIIADGTATSTASASLAWLDATPPGRERDPFFLYLHFMEPHWTYSPPQAYADVYAPSLTDDDKAQLNRKIRRAFRKQFKGRLDGLQKLTCDELMYLESMYDGEVAWLDDGLKALFAQLDERHVLDNTIVVITADHGEEFLDHGRLWHGYTLYEECVRVPLIVRLPGQQHGQTFNQMVSLIDLAPSLLDLLGLPPQKTFDEFSFAPMLAPRRSLRQWIDAWRGRTPPERRQVIAQLTEGHGDDVYPRLHASMVIEQATKLLVRNDGTLETYDLAGDPGEAVSKRDWRPDLRAQLLAALRQTEASSEERSRPRDTVTLDDAAKERLAALGYLEPKDDAAAADADAAPVAPAPADAVVGGDQPGITRAACLQAKPATGQSDHGGAAAKPTLF
jgi:arylsulfatase A-like enzyme